MSRAMVLLLGVLCVFTIPWQATEQTKPTDRVAVILDTDLGSDVDDAFALALAVASPELEIVAVTTVGEQAEDRAVMACRFLALVGRKEIPVAFGRGTQPKGEIDWQIQYRRHPAAIFNRAGKPAKESAVELMYRQLKARPGEITLVALGPLTNFAQLLKDHPDAKPWIKRIVLMGGGVYVGYNGKPPAEPEWNIKSDIAAAKAVFASGVPLEVAPLDATASLSLDQAHRDKLFSARTPLTFQVQNLYELWDKETPILFDPVAVALAFENKFFKLKELRLEIDDMGRTLAVAGKPNARVATGTAEHFFAWYVQRLTAHGQPTLPKPPGHRTKLAEQGGFPVRVHAFEDFDTDIEKRWWMCGKLETKDVPPGGRRACRAVLTQDFDDRQGQLDTTYRAVIFNPVPGPPMGPNTRLTFKYKLTGTDTVRVQLYTLSKGYHRYLSVDGLKQGAWASATVDMTKMRRPDGSGGPLSEDERIDDIQFYVDPRAELLIDDIVLHEAAPAGEQRPFPARILYTGLFDTGKQGKEWQGDFEIVPHEKPRTWKAARSVLNPKTKQPWIRLDLKGERRLDEKVELFFRYRLTGTDALRMELVQRKSGATVTHELQNLNKIGWASMSFAFRPEVLKGGDRMVDEIRFLLPAGTELQLDDVLLYVPGNQK